jgi:hypothetical protein
MTLPEKLPTPPPGISLDFDWERPIDENIEFIRGIRAQKRWVAFLLNE